MAKSEANWIEIDINGESIGSQQYHAEYKEAYRKAKVAKERFEAQMREDYMGRVPAGMRLVFGYNFGKLSVAIVPDDAKPKKAKVEARTLADYLRQQNG